METTLSSKGQIVLPKKARQRLALRAGTKFTCQIEGGTIVLKPRNAPKEKPRLTRDPLTGLTITVGHSAGPTVTSNDIRALLEDFP